MTSRPNCQNIELSIDRISCIEYPYYQETGRKRRSTVDTKRLGQRIGELRRRTGMSQENLAKLLDVSRPAISQMEKGTRKISAGELVRLSEVFNLASVESLLGLKKEPEVILQRGRKMRATEARIRINVPQRNVERFKEVLLYILNQVGAKPNVGETVIYKLLYFIDFDYYEKYEEQLIGATYLKNRFGPTPIEFKKIVDQMMEEGEIEKLKSKYFQYDQTKYLPLRKPDLSTLKASEIEVIDDVLNRLAGWGAAQISEYSHNDVPWLTVDEGRPLEYEAVFYRTPPYSVREYPNELS
jgi:transcriptional regulator with XRE-family HTH domain